ncbi:hypothetical protein [Vallitalea guaymasensis]|uniref:Uncharacterized protein n=1 Tax=Vallitalea guaymasensis TaxID=1185412 RepID=A0A8J8SBM8_9FIRM|nr:hypothetical protein [Vallitalea guaymasensis]QUH28824.1 hypothetical protein HYG85_07810 [Vallitalea guaymasensis]
MSLLIGYLDDEYDYESNIKRNLKKHDIELVTLKDIDDVQAVSDLVNVIMDRGLQCLFVDYDLLKLKSKIYGTHVIKDINDIIPSFPCFLLTHYAESGISEKVVPSTFIQDKEIFQEDYDSEEFVAFIDKIKNSIECFTKRLEIDLEDYKKLFVKRKKEDLIADEELKFHTLYKVLKAYQYVDELPDYFLYKETEKKLDSMLELLDDLKNSLDKR